VRAKLNSSIRIDESMAQPARRGEVRASIWIKRKIGQARTDVAKATGGDQIHGKRIATAGNSLTKMEFDDQIGCSHGTGGRAEAVNAKWEMVKLAFKNSAGTDDFPSMMEDVPFDGATCAGAWREAKRIRN
jgi:hypothetical protein